MLLYMLPHIPTGRLLDGLAFLARVSVIILKGACFLAQPRGMHDSLHIDKMSWSSQNDITLL
jgi:hypothetical protein